MGPSNAAGLVDRKFIAANIGFGFQLLTELYTGKNVFVSPASIALALAMTYNGAEGTTKQAMARTLGIEGMDIQGVNEANAILRAALENPDPKVQLAIANSLWAKKDLTFKPDFMQRNRDFYGAEVANVNFTDPGTLPTINGWVEKKTNRKIKDLVKPIDLNSLTIVILINAIYFKGLWKKPFDKADTREGNFTLLDGSRKACPMMSQSGHYKYYQDKNLQAVSLPYGGGRISMYIFLPSATVSFDKFQKSLNVTNWEQWMPQLHEMEGNIVLPRFKLEYEAELSDPLTALGMGIAFSQDANFAGMCDKPARISKVRHKTFLDINEEGTEAAAATAVVMQRLSPSSTFTMTVDRPFFCAIRDNKTGALLFMGAVVEPG